MSLFMYAIAALFMYNPAYTQHRRENESIDFHQVRLHNIQALLRLDAYQLNVSYGLKFYCSLRIL